MSPPSSRRQRFTAWSIVTALPLWLSSCAPTLPPAFAAPAEQARIAYAQGRYADAAQYWTRAAPHADTAHLKDDARYRAAHSWLKAGERQRGEAILRDLSAADGPRAPRATFDLCRLELSRCRDSGCDEGPGQAMLSAAVLRFPGAGMAPNALRQHAVWLSETQGLSAALEYTTTVIVSVRGYQTEQTARFLRARFLRLAGRQQDALSAFRDLIKRFPYPEGVHWDEAHLEGAELALELGRTAQAKDLLESMLAHRESASITGSYDKRYATARYRLAEALLAEGNHGAARAMWLELVREHPTNRLKDDALWRASVVAAQHGDAEAACKTARQLLQVDPDSRFARCAHAICPAIPPNERCADYVLRTLN